MNKFIHTIHEKQLIIYKRNKEYYVIDNDIYILVVLLKFNYCYKNNRKVIFINSDYIDYILKKLRNGNINYVLININYGYDRILEYKVNNNMYSFYYEKGKRIVRNERKVKYVIDILNKFKDIKLLEEVELIIRDG